MYMLQAKPNNIFYENKWYKNIKVFVFVLEILLKVFVFVFKYICIWKYLYLYLYLIFWKVFVFVFKYFSVYLTTCLLWGAFSKFTNKCIYTSIKFSHLFLYIKISIFIMNDNTKVLAAVCDINLSRTKIRFVPVHIFRDETHTHCFGTVK